MPLMAERTITRRVRLTPDEEALLTRIATERKTDVSKVIREAIQALDRESQRREAWAEMIRLAQEDQKRLKGRRPPKESWSLK